MRLERYFAVALAIALGSALFACTAPPARQDTLDAIRARGELVWGADLQGGEPYLWEDPQSKTIVGFEVEIMAAVARHLGVKQRVAHYNWSNLGQSLDRGDFDIAFNGIEATAARAAQYRLTAPYFVYAQTLTVKAGSKLDSGLAALLGPHLATDASPVATASPALSHLRSTRVGTLNQTHAHDLLIAAGAEVVLYEGNEEPYIDLQNGRIDAVLMDNIIADRYGCNRADLHCLPHALDYGVYVGLVRKRDTALANAIDQALQTMQRNGELAAILRKAKLWNQQQQPPTLAAVAQQRVPFDAEASAATSATGTKRAPPAVPRFDGDQWQRFGTAAGVTLLITFAAFAIAVPLGMLLGIARTYGGSLVRACARGYIEIFRGTPALLQLYFLYYALADVVSLTALQAAIIGLGLNYAAYEAEVYRAALTAIPRGQTEAAKALGLSPWLTLRHILGPQALRMALPAMTNDLVSLLKDSSLVSTITVIELTKRMQISASHLRDWLVPSIACAAFYLVLSLPLSELARRLERRLSRDHHPATL